MFSCESVARFSTRGVQGISFEISSTELVLNSYGFMVRNEYRIGSCNAIINCVTYMEPSLLMFASSTEYPCYIMISSQSCVLLVTTQSLMGGQCPYVGDGLTTILERYVHNNGNQLQYSAVHAQNDFIGS